MPIKLTFEYCKEVALKYNKRNLLRKNDASCYRTSLKNGWLNEICLHMDKKLSKRIWTDEQLDFLINNMDKKLSYLSDKLNKSKCAVQNKKYKIKKLIF